MTLGNRDTIRIYIADITPLKEEALFERAYFSVSAVRRDKTDRMRFPEGKRQSLGAECLLMRACRDFGVDYTGAEVTADGNGKPGFCGLPLFFNLSHSKDRVMCVMSALPNGCDTEQIHSADTEIAKRFFDAEEYKLLEHCSMQEERDELFFRLWTLKESFQKCTGLGFQLSLNAFSVLPGADGIRLKQSVDSGEYVFSEKRTEDDYLYACCIRGNVSPENFQWETVDLRTE